jgi:hypothetical protein
MARPNLDDYAEPRRSEADWSARRGVLTDQLGWLIDEADALGPLLKPLPEEVLVTAPLPGERSVVATLALIAGLDREVRTPQIAAFAQGDSNLAFSPADEAALLADDVDRRPLDEVLAEVKAERRALLDTLGTVEHDAWHREATWGGETLTLFDLALHIARRDADELRTLAYRLHEARLSDRVPPSQKPA